MIFVVCSSFSKSTFLKNSFRNTIRVSKSLDPGQDRHSVGPDLGQNSLHRLLADDTIRQRVKYAVLIAEYVQPHHLCKNDPGLASSYHE